VVPNLVINAIMILVTVAIAFTISPLVAILMLVILPLNYFGYKALNKKLSQLCVNLSRTSSEAFRDINTIISQVDFIKQNANNEYLLPTIAGHIDRSMAVRKSVNYVANGVSGLLVGANQVIQTIIIIYLAAMALSDHAMFGGALYVILILPYFGNAVRGLTNTNLGFAGLKAADDFI
jgi:ABC-type multidrug transport system fused ATPase/permease subunit